MCTANLCRSPAAAALLAAGLPAGSAVGVTSAGTSAAVGEEVPQRLVRTLARWGVDVAGHRPRQLTAEQIEVADLVLVATRAHRSTVVGAVPGALRRTFALRELARLLSAPRSPRWLAADVSDDPTATRDGEGVTRDGDVTIGDGELARWEALAPTAARRRGAAAGADDDLADPYRRSTRAYRASVEQIALATTSILTAADAVGLSGLER